jgi:hypothetical protein
MVVYGNKHKKVYTPPNNFRGGYEGCGQMKWCNHYNCWCNDAEDITDGMGDCDYECNGCEDCEEIK